MGVDHEERQALSINNNIIIDNQGARASSIQTVANRIKCIPQEKFMIFVSKVAISGLHLTFL